MARDDGNENSATTSFSILLGDSPHLDKKYTVFGHVVNDAESKKTIEKLQANFFKRSSTVCDWCR